MVSEQTFQEGYYRTENGEWKIVVNHEIPSVLPHMVDWWWDHMDRNTYVLWHPTDHQSFQWIVPPEKHGHVGAVQRIEELLNGIGIRPDVLPVPATLCIRWEDATNVDTEYAHVLLATVTGDAQGRLMHEYEEMTGGLRMRSHFTLAKDTPEIIVQALVEHNKQEMSNFSAFLPSLYSKSSIL